MARLALSNRKHSLTTPSLVPFINLLHLPQPAAVHSPTQATQILTTVIFGLTFGH